MPCDNCTVMAERVAALEAQLGRTPADDTLRIKRIQLETGLWPGAVRVLLMLMDNVGAYVSRKDLFGDISHNGGSRKIYELRRALEGRGIMHSISRINGKGYMINPDAVRAIKVLIGEYRT